MAELEEALGSRFRSTQCRNKENDCSVGRGQCLHKGYIGFVRASNASDTDTVDTFFKKHYQKSIRGGIHGSYKENSPYADK